MQVRAGRNESRGGGGGPRTGSLVDVDRVQICPCTRGGAPPGISTQSQTQPTRRFFVQSPQIGQMAFLLIWPVHASAPRAPGRPATPVPSSSPRLLQRAPRGHPRPTAAPPDPGARADVEAQSRAHRPSPTVRGRISTVTATSQARSYAYAHPTIFDASPHIAMCSPTNLLFTTFSKLASSILHPSHHCFPALLCFSYAFISSSPSDLSNGPPASTPPAANRVRVSIPFILTAHVSQYVTLRGGSSQSIPGSLINAQTIFGPSGTHLADPHVHPGSTRTFCGWVAITLLNFTSRCHQEELCRRLRIYAARQMTQNARRTPSSPASPSLRAQKSICLEAGLITKVHITR